MKLFTMAIAALLLAGCSNVLTQYAVYQNPATGDVLECEQLHSGGVVDNVPDVFGLDAYAKCKSSLEERGYKRLGTVNHPRRSRTAEETLTPRPAPTEAK